MVVEVYGFDFTSLPEIVRLRQHLKQVRGIASAQQWSTPSGYGCCMDMGGSYNGEPLLTIGFPLEKCQTLPDIASLG